jgi:hypothetical protein
VKGVGALANPDSLAAIVARVPGSVSAP